MNKRIKKELINRCLIGMPSGLVICQIISILISLIKNDGNYYHVTPQLIDICKNETYAVILQTLCAFVYGAVWTGSTVIWMVDEWSFLRQNVTHFLITSIVTFPIAYLTHWMNHTPAGIAGYFGSFIIAYAAIWWTQYCSMKKRVTQLNAAVSANAESQFHTNQ